MMKMEKTIKTFRMIEWMIILRIIINTEFLQFSQQGGLVPRTPLLGKSTSLSMVVVKVETSLRLCTL